MIYYHRFPNVESTVSVSRSRHEAAMTKCTAWLQQDDPNNPSCLFGAASVKQVGASPRAPEVPTQRPRGEVVRAKWRKDKNRLLLLSAPARRTNK